jgi:tetratricopeptide (TPR) repeat protein
MMYITDNKMRWIKMSANKTLLLAVLFLCASGLVFTQYEYEYEYEQPDEPGYLLYREGRFMEAAVELRLAQESAADLAAWTEASYWLILAELSLSDFGSAIWDMDDLQDKAPDSRRARDLVYHRGLALFHLEYFDEAIMLFKSYADNAGERDRLRKSSAYYWMGECLYLLELPEMALDFYHLVIKQYPDSLKHEAAASRIAEIKYKAIEDKLFTLLNSLHTEMEHQE